MRVVRFRNMKHFLRIAAVLAIVVFNMTFMVAGSALAVVIANPDVPNPVVIKAAPPAMKSQVVTPAFRPPVLSPFTRFRIPGFIPVRPPGFNPFLRPNLFQNGDDRLFGNLG